jgi:hypothetical protein
MPVGSGVGVGVRVGELVGVGLGVKVGVGVKVVVGVGVSVANRFETSDTPQDRLATANMDTNASKDTRPLLRFIISSLTGTACR